MSQEYLYSWTNIVTVIKGLKTEFDRSYKCLNKSELPKVQTQLKHLRILIDRHNQAVAIYAEHELLLTTAHKNEFTNFLNTLKNRLESLFERLGVEEEVPKDPNTKISTDTFVTAVLSGPESSSDDSDSEKLETPTTMTITVAEFLSSASKLLPTFDGKFVNLQPFLDAINLIDLIKDTHESVAVNLIKSKLTGTARNLITSEATIIAISGKLKSSIKAETTQSVAAKLLNAKQANKSANDYIKEIEELAAQLENAYISDGIPHNVAKTYSTQTALKSLTKNAKGEKAKLLLQAGNYTTLSEVVTKFVELSNDSEDVFKINLVRNDKQHYNNRNYRGKYKKNNNYNGQQNRQNQNSNNRRGGNNYRGNGRNNQQNYNNNQQNRNVRAIEAAPENVNATQQAQLGAHFQITDLQ